MKHGKTAVYTILKDEIRNLDRWLYYAEPFDYRVLLDTGSTDGSYETLLELAEKDLGLIVEQKEFKPWRFDVPRRYNLSMVPQDVVWCLSPDLDEFYSINTHDEMERIISHVPTITDIACDRLDIYSRTVRVGPPNHIPTNKIHLRADYTWVQPVYEHLSWIHQDRYENELYSEDIFLIHDQDFRQKRRPELYVALMEEEYAHDPTNTWNLWYLLYHYYKSQQVEKYICGSIDFIKHHKNHNDQWFKTISGELTNIYRHQMGLTQEVREEILSVLKGITL